MKEDIDRLRNKIFEMYKDEVRPPPPPEGYRWVLEEQDISESHDHYHVTTKFRLTRAVDTHPTNKEVDKLISAARELSFARGYESVDLPSLTAELKELAETYRQY